MAPSEEPVNSTPKPRARSPDGSIRTTVGAAPGSSALGEPQRDA